jgi:hypothetical protein
MPYKQASKHQAGMVPSALAFATKKDRLAAAFEIPVRETPSASMRAGRTKPESSDGTMETDCPRHRLAVSQRTETGAEGIGGNVRCSLE